MRLISTRGRSSHPALNVVDELECAIARSAPDVRVRSGRFLPQAAGRVLWELHQRNLLPPRRSGSPQGGTGEDRLAILMGPQFQRCLPAFLRPGRNYVYLFDAWPGADADIVDFARRFRVDHLFISARQSAERLAVRLPEVPVTWVPEGVDPSRYRARPHAERRIDVLQFGRKWDRYHDLIAAPLERAGKRYRYEEEPGRLVFPSREAFAAGLADARISICFPSSTTHPERAGGVATMTTRYLQSMASRCLVVGECPPEMSELFGYEPVIRADEGDPAGQLLHILAHFDEHEERIERNAQVVRAAHTWTHRWQTMREFIRKMYSGDAGIPV